MVNKTGIAKNIKGDLIARSKKAFTLTEDEKRSLKNLKKKTIRKLPSKRKLKKIGRSVDFSRLF